MTAQWTLQLDSYDEAAPATLYAQHELLQIVRDLNDPSVRLSFRVTGTLAHGEVQAQCRLHCFASRRKVGDVLHEMASVGLIRGYNLRQVAAVEDAEPEHWELLPSLGRQYGPPIKPDWAILFDLIRHRGKPIAIDLTVSHTRGSGDAGARPALVLDESDPGAAILQTLSSAPDHEKCIKVAITCWGDGARDSDIMRAYGRRLTGLPCDVVPLEGNQPVGLQVTTAEAVRIWHAPYGDVLGRGLTRRATRIPLESRAMPKTGSSLGTANMMGPRYDRRVEVTPGWADRMRHLYIVGKTGSGKTNLMKRIARQDIAAGKGCVVVSPHSDLIDHLIDTAGKRLDDVILLDFADYYYTPCINPLVIDVNTDADYLRAVDQVIDIIIDMTYHEFAGPVFRDNVRTALQTIGLEGIRGNNDPTISMGLEIVRDRDLRAWAEKVARPIRRDLANEWSNVTNLKSSDVAEFVRWITAKFSDFSTGGALRSATSTVHGSAISFRSIYRDKKILLVHIPDSRLGSQAAEFLGRFIFNRLYEEARVAPSSRRHDFLVHVDEFQRFVGNNLEVLITEARKFRLGLAFAHQNLRQLQRFSLHEGSTTPRMAEAVFSNVGTLVTMRSSGGDVDILAKELQVRDIDIRGIAQYEALARCTLNGVEGRAMTLQIPLESVPPNRAARREIRQRMIREGYWASKASILSALDDQLSRLAFNASPISSPKGQGTISDPGRTSPSFLDEWLAKRKARGATPAGEDEDGDKKVGPAANPKQDASLD